MRTFLAVLLVSSLAVAPSAAADAPSFFVILSDDQSWAGSSVPMLPGDPRSRSDYFQTPGLERLAHSGMLFTNGYAPAPFCCPTRRSLQVGQTPARHVYQVDQRSWAERYRRQLNIPRVLKAADSRYRTAHFGKWDHRFDRPSPEDMGYDLSDGDTGNGTGGGKGSGGPAAVSDPKLIDHLTRRASEFLAEQAASGSPFYLQVSHYAVHLDIYYRGGTLDRVRLWPAGRKHYLPEFAAMTADMDASIGLLLDRLADLGLAESTYVFFLSDNGGRATLPGAGTPPVPRNAPLRGAKGTMYEGGIRVPFVVAGPGIEPGSVSHVPVTGLDILPTVADLAGYPASLPGQVDGGSLRPVLRGGGTVERSRDFLIFHQAVGRKAQTALRLGDWKLVKTWADSLVELFHLGDDLGETENLAGRFPERAGELRRRMAHFLREAGAETRRTTD